MNRQQFLVTLWSKFFKPLMMVTGLIYCLFFFFNALDADSNERQLLEVLVVGFILAGILLFVRILLEYIGRLIKLNIPPSLFHLIKQAFPIVMVGVLVFIIIWLIYNVYLYVSAGDYTKLWAMAFILMIFLLRYFSDKHNTAKP